MAARVGRPRKNIDFQEWFAWFARLSAEHRRYALDVMRGIDVGLTPVSAQESDDPFRQTEEPIESRE
jgi:hypothetical protein